MSNLPFTLQYEIDKLRSELKEIEQKITSLPEHPNGVLDFSRAKFQRDRVRVESDIRSIEEMLSPDPNGPHNGPGGGCLA